MRWLFLLATIPGCLWIGGAEHDERKRSIDPEFVLLDITPDTWSACAGPPTFTVVGQVASRHAGRTFDAWFEVDGQRQDAGSSVAGSDGSILFDVSPGDLAPGCAGTCPVTFTVGVSHLGFDDQADVNVSILGETDPVVGQAALVAADGTLGDLATLSFDDNPAHSVAQADWPTLAVGLVDPYLFDPGPDLVVQIALCPEGVSPATGMASCVVQEAVVSEHAVAGDVVYETSTEAFAEAACAEGVLGASWDPYVILDNHPCASNGLVDVGMPLRLVVPDCDADGYTVEDGDCDDDDPAFNPDALETWYDGIDQDCDGSDDYDRDGDGVLGGPTGTDCDDTDALTYPGAPEICDASDNDCDGVQLLDVVTVESGPIVDLYATLDEALASAGDGDVVRICPGTFTGSFVIDKDLTVIGSGPDQSVLRPSAPGQPVVDVVGELTVVLEGVELTGATDATGTLRGGGLRAPDVTDLTLSDVRVIGNEADEGAGLLLGGSTLIQDSLVSTNDATLGGGIYLERGSSLTLEGTDISGNTAFEGGGMVMTDNVVLTMDGASTVRSNTATHGGGLLMLDDTEVYGGAITANIAVEGGGVYARAERDTVPIPYLEGVLIADHTAPLLQRGGAIYAVGEGMELAVYDCVLEDNAVGGDGGAISVVSSGLYAAVAYVELSEIRNNTAGGDGGGLHVENSFIYAYDSTVDGNQANRGGGFFGDLFIGELAITLSNNVALGDGGGLYAADGLVWNYYDRLELVDNSAVQGGGGYLDDTWVVVPDSVLTGNSATGLGGGYYITNQGHAGMWGAGTVSGNTSQSGQTNGVWVSADADSFVSCSTMTWSDSVGCDADPAAGVPANNCFSVYPTGLDDGQCDICP